MSLPSIDNVEFLRAANPVNLAPASVVSPPPVDGRIEFYISGESTYTVDALNNKGDGAEVYVGKKPSGRQFLTILRIRKAALVEMIDGKNKKSTVNAIKSLLLESGDWYVLQANSGGRPVEVGRA